MAKTFGGFTTQQQQKMLSPLGYTGPAQQDDMNKFMMASPKAASMMGKYTEAARARVQGGPNFMMHVGGDVPLDTSEAGSLADAAVSQQVSKDQQTNVMKTTDVMQPMPMPAQPMPMPAVMPEQPIQEMPIPGQQPIQQPMPIMQQPMRDYRPSQNIVDMQKKFITSPVAQRARKAQQFLLNQNLNRMGISNIRQLRDLPQQQRNRFGDMMKSSIQRNPEVMAFNRAQQQFSRQFQPLVKSDRNDFFNRQPQMDVPTESNQQRRFGAIGYNEGGNVFDAETGTYNYMGQQYDNAEDYSAAVESQNSDTSSDTDTNVGGETDTTPDYSDFSLDPFQENVASETSKLTDLTSQLANFPAPVEGEEPSEERKALEEQIKQQQAAVTQAKSSLSSAESQYQMTQLPSTTELKKTGLDDPTSLITTQEVEKTTEEQRKAGKMAEGVGQAPEDVTKANTVEAKIASDVKLLDEFEAAGYTAKEAAAEVRDVLNKLSAATGKPSDEALAEAATMDPEDLAQLGLTVEQIERAQRVEEVPDLQFTEGMKVEGAVDFERAKKEVNFEAATGAPSTEATVKGQLTSLMEDFEGGEPPGWAAGAMRNAAQQMAARGLGASSVAAQSIVHAAMQSALPIAMQDAKTVAQFEAQNLSNKQQAAMFAAEQRANFLQLDFTQEFQARVQNAAKVADIAKINFTADQQVALENARLAQSVDLANLDAKNAKIMADAAAMTAIDTANLNNRQQAQVQQAEAFLAMDMKNLDNKQQTAIFKSQTLSNALLSDASAVNAERQFNASSQNQVDMFFSNLKTDIQKHNAEQENAINTFNAGEANAIDVHNSTLKNNRDQFNANNALIIEQANTQWEQKITTTDNAAQNAANRDATIQANDLTETAYNNMLQMERDMIDYVWRSADNELARENAYMISAMQTQAQVDQARGSGIGKIFNTFITAWANKLFT